MTGPGPRPTASMLGSGLFRGCRVGLLGGSFNPAHDGHLALSRIALARLRLDAVWWLVSPQNPLKATRGMAPLDERLRTAQAIAGGERRIWVSALERDLGTRYTVDTVLALRRRVPATRFVWLMGADNLRQLPRWRAWPRIFDTLPIAVLARAPDDFAALAGPAARRYRRARLSAADAPRLTSCRPPAWLFLALRHHPASATAIRAARVAGTSPNAPFRRAWASR